MNPRKEDKDDLTLREMQQIYRDNPDKDWEITRRPDGETFAKLDKQKQDGVKNNV